MPQVPLHESGDMLMREVRNQIDQSGTPSDPTHFETAVFVILMIAFAVGQATS